MNFLKKIIVHILALESRLIISKYKPFIIAVTGSVGKTSTKDAIYDVLKDQGDYVRKGEKSFNSEVGLPLTVIGVPNAWRNFRGWLRNMGAGLKLIFTRGEYPGILILELGADHPGDIRKVVKWLKPDIAVITKVSSTPVHVEFFKSPEEVFEEKSALAASVKNGGTLVLFADDDKTASMAELLKGRDVRILTYGIDKPATARGTNYAVEYASGGPTGMSFDLDLIGEASRVRLKNVTGSQYMYPLLAAAAVGKAKDVSLSEIVKALNSYEAPKGRMNVIAGMNGSTLIDDTYNSSPDAVVVALETLKHLDCPGSKIAVLGDMMELGKYAAEEHRKIGALAADIVTRLITVGPRSRMTAQEAVLLGMKENAIHSFDTASEAAAFLSPLVSVGDIVLIKGSQSIRMERVTKALMKESEKASELLVRQEREWLLKA
jgi:UDP-N-acetylmuramoyl-tripeptide--D-alanyl-D-alanine ligase